MDRGGRQDGNKEVSGPRYLRVVDVIRSLEPLLQHVPISHHAAADCTRQVALAVQVTCEEAHEGIRRQGTAQVVDKAHTENTTALPTVYRKLAATGISNNDLLIATRPLDV